MIPIHPTLFQHIFLLTFITVMWGTTVWAILFSGQGDFPLVGIIVNGLLVVQIWANITFWRRRFQGTTPNFPDPKRIFLKISLAIGMVAGVVNYVILSPGFGAIIFTAAVITAIGILFFGAASLIVYQGRSNEAQVVIAFTAILALVGLFYGIFQFRPGPIPYLLLPLAIVHPVISFLPILANYMDNQEMQVARGQAASLSVTEQMDYLEETLTVPLEDLKDILPNLPDQNPVRLYPHLQEQNQMLPRTLIQFPARQQIEYLETRKAIQQQLADWETELGKPYKDLKGLWCTRHEQWGEVQKWKKIYWAECEECQSGKYLIHNVTAVRGVLYPTTKNHTPPTIELQVWDEKTKKIIPRNITELEIPAGNHLSHDWFVTAFCNWLSESPPKSPILVLLEPGFDLSENATRMLKDAEIAGRLELPGIA